MKRLLVTILILCSLHVILLAQDTPLKYDTLRKRIKTEIKAPDSASRNKTKQEFKQTIHTESKAIKSSVKTELKQSLPDSTDKKQIKDTGEKKLTDKATNLQYDSDNPDDAPWKKKQLSKDDLKDFDLTPKEPGVPSINGDKAKTYTEKIKTLKPSSVGDKKLPDEEKVKSELIKKSQSEKLDKAKSVSDSIITVYERVEATSVEEELLGAKKVYSEKYMRKLYDSLGITKGDSLFRIGSALARKEIPKEDLIQKINTPLQKNSGTSGMSFDEENQVLKTDDADKLGALPDQYSKTDLSSLQLPPDVLSELAPLMGTLMDSKYMPVIDSMREVVMKAKGYKLDEEHLTEELKRTAMKKKPRFIDKSYFEGILSFVNDTTFSIVKISPAWAYRFKNRFSAGLGPDISILYQSHKINAVVGFRSFVKSEFYKQRLYAQLEDNISQSQINKDAIRKNVHSLLAGGGGLLPISKKLAINLALFYRVNQKDMRPGGSPWVFRIGLSSNKKIGQK